MLDGRYSRTERLEAATHPDAAHNALDVARVLPDDPVAQLEHLRLHIGLGRLDLAPASDAFIGGDPDDRAVRDDRALQISDFHVWGPSSNAYHTSVLPLSTFRGGNECALWGIGQFSAPGLGVRPGWW
jgi:hypothetical protein